MKIKNIKNNKNLFLFYKGYFDPTKRFYAQEPRAFCYDISLEMIDDARKLNESFDYCDEPVIKGIILLLYCWNFASRETKKLNFNSIQNLLLKNKDDLRRLEEKSLELTDKADLDTAEKIFYSFRKILGQTGASKALSLLNPRLFMLWDTPIRKNLRLLGMKGIGNGSNAGEYRMFLEWMKDVLVTMQQELRLDNSELNAKKLDEFHYLKFSKNFFPK